MFRKLCYALALFVAGSSSLPAAEGLREFESLKLKYGVAMESTVVSLESLRERYKARLVEIEKLYTKKGDLDGVLAAKSAIAAGDPDPKKIDSNPAEIAKLQRIFEREKASKLRQHKEETLSLCLSI